MTTLAATSFEILTGVQSVDNYPYGSLKCTMSFWVEFKPKKGFRCVTQSINPKTNRLNKPKYSVYTHFAFMHRDADTGHIKFVGADVHGDESLNSFIELLKANDFEFTPEQSKDILNNVLTNIAISYAYVKGAENKAKYLALTNYVGIKLMTDVNQLKEFDFNLKAIKDLALIY